MTPGEKLAALKERLQPASREVALWAEPDYVDADWDPVDAHTWRHRVTGATFAWETGAAVGTLTERQPR